MSTLNSNPRVRKPGFDIKKVRKKAVKLETKDGKVILDKNNPKHRALYND